VHVVNRIGHPLRWSALVVLLVLAAGWAWERRGGPLLPRAVGIATGALLAVALVSALWSVDPRLSFERAVSLGILLTVCFLLAQATAGRPREIEHVLLGVLGGAAAVAVAGLIVLVADHAHSVQAATIDIAQRYQGLGENPDTASLLYAVTLPIGVWFLLTARTRGRRALAAATVLLLYGSVVASISRGALLAGALGTVVLVVAWGGRTRRTAVAVVTIVAALAVGAGLEALPKPNSAAAAPPARSVPAPKSAARPSRYVDVEANYPLDADIGRPLPGGGEPWKPRSFFGASGRSVAWTGALEQAWGRPLVGYGFGTERLVFVDRYFAFVGGLVENSYIGLALQLGIVGVVLLLALVATLVVTGWPALGGPERSLAAACLGVLLAGLAIAAIQSYVYSVGNTATAALWISAFLLPAVAAGGAVRRA